jgi:alkylhydroperoxidase family enzyme
VTPEDWQALKTGDFTRFTDAERDALKFAEKLTKTPWEVNPSDIDMLKRHFSEAQIVDLDLLVGVANVTNRFTDPLGAELETAAEKV